MLKENDGKTDLTMKIQKLFSLFTPGNSILLLIHLHLKLPKRQYCRYKHMNVSLPAISLVCTPVWVIAPQRSRGCQMRAPILDAAVCKIWSVTLFLKTRSIRGNTYPNHWRFLSGEGLLLSVPLHSPFTLPHRTHMIAVPVWEKLLACREQIFWFSSNQKTLRSQSSV